VRGTEFNSSSLLLSTLQRYSGLSIVPKEIRNKIYPPNPSVVGNDLKNNINNNLFKSYLVLQ
jgi:hypothetical protein